MFILADDLDVGVYAKMPRMKQLMNDQGLTFSSAFVSLSLCCPSRAAILRGQYAHNNGIFNNAPPDGGFETFYAEGSETETLPVWMSRAGYRTVLMGKYLNGYPNTAPMDYIPSGWSEWYSSVDGYPYDETGYTLNENGVNVAYGRAAEDYLTDVLARKATELIARSASDPTPFFMYIAPYAPHAPATPAQRYAKDFVGVQAPRTASFNEPDFADKPSWMATNPQLTDTEIADIDALYRKRLQSMEAIEDLVSNVVDALAAADKLDTTYIVFTSDNGFHQGQHRFPSGKDTEFDEDLRVPLVIRGPGVPAGATIDAYTLNVDFAPTFLDLAGTAITDAVDGRSLVPLLRGAAPATWRRSVFLEHGREFNTIARTTAPIGTLEPADQLVTATTRINAPPFNGVRTGKYTYVVYQSGDRELYDHEADPDQLTNIAATADPALVAKLTAIIQAMHRCKGAECRTAEEAGD